MHACCAFVLYRSYIYVASTSQSLAPFPSWYTFIVPMYVSTHMPLNIKSAFSRFRSTNHTDNPDPNDCIRPTAGAMMVYIYEASSADLWHTVFNTRAVYSVCAAPLRIFLFLIIRSKTDFSRFPDGGYTLHDPVVV